MSTIENICVELPVSPYLNDNTITLSPATAKLCLPLEEGEHTAESITVEAGSFYDGGKILARLSVWYNFCAAENTLTLCSAELDTKDASRLSLYMQEDGNKLCEFYASPNQATKFGSLGKQLEKGRFNVLEHRMETILKRTMEQVKKEALQCGLTVLMRTPVPDLTEPEESKLQVLFQQGAFAGFAEPDKSYGSDVTVHPIRSVWGGTVTFNHGENFANVIGSDHDRRIAGITWIQLWQNQFGIAASTCTSLHYGGQTRANNYPCDTTLYGGHVVSGRIAHTVAYGSNSVYIMPICIQHNNDDTVYMAALQYVDGIWLNNYHNP